MANMKLNAVLCVTLLSLTAIPASTPNAADYPARPIRYVVAFAPGGINDILARIVGQKLSDAWGQPVIVDNRPGAGGNVGAELVAKSTADGYTILNISTAHTISQSLYRKLGYSLERDLTPVVWLGGSSLIMVVTPSLPVKSVTELVAWAKSNRLIYASGGVGVISHLSLEMFKGAAKIDATHVPYKGVGPSIPDLISGQVHVMINAIPELFPYAKGGRLRIIAALTEKRHPFMPDVPTMIEQGYPDFVLSNWVGIVTAAGTPKPVVNKLAAEVTRILKLPDVAGKLTDQGFDPSGGTPEAFGKLIHSEIARFGKAVKDSGAHVD
jgi:tripartite-type tricarboxylate transporter receptor subunit TctC